MAPTSVPTHSANEHKKVFHFECADRMLSREAFDELNAVRRSRGESEFVFDEHGTAHNEAYATSLYELDQRLALDDDLERIIERIGTARASSTDWPLSYIEVPRYVYDYGLYYWNFDGERGSSFHVHERAVELWRTLEATRARVHELEAERRSSELYTERYAPSSASTCANAGESSVA